jgi:Zn-dependent protease with chaperone function
MTTLAPDQILVISVVSVWFLFPLGMLVSFIKQANEEHAPKVSVKMTANEIAHSKAYASEINEDDEFNLTPISPYHISKPNQNPHNYHPHP